MSGLSLAQQQIATAIINGSGNGITCIDDGNALHLMRESGEVLISFQHSSVADLCSTSGSAGGSAGGSASDYNFESIMAQNKEMWCQIRDKIRDAPREPLYRLAAAATAATADSPAHKAVDKCSTFKAAGGGSGSESLDDLAITDNGGGGSKFAPSLSWAQAKWCMHCSSPFPAKDTMRRNAVLGYIKCPNGETLQALHIVNTMSAREKAVWQNENGFVSKYDKHTLALALRIFSNWKHLDYLNESARRANGRARRARRSVSHNEPWDIEEMRALYGDDVDHYCPV
jgi:hypothetical protein